MDRRKIIIANWKMNKTQAEALAFLQALNLSQVADLLIAAPFTLLLRLAEASKNRSVVIGAQNMYFESKGAFTGEISAEMLKDAGAKFVLLGHSERRHLFYEDNELIHKKIQKAIASTLRPVLCIGETLDEREAHETHNVLKEQLDECLQDIPSDDLEDLIIAYEPVWAIGSGLAATQEQVEEVHAFIRKWVGEEKSQTLSKKIPILYGGSVKPQTLSPLLACRDIDGFLVGSASLNVETFNHIVKEV